MVRTGTRMETNSARSANQEPLPHPLACVDVHYWGDQSATAACVLFDWWTDTAPRQELVATVPKVHAYVPGSFYLRELPCLLKVLKLVKAQLDTIVIDGYVWLGPDRPGLGVHLYEALGKQTPVIGVAKSPFRGAAAIEVLRGNSKRPLLVTAAGIEPRLAAQLIQDMAGEFRVPFLLKRVDQLCRSRQHTD